MCSSQFGCGLEKCDFRGADVLRGLDRCRAALRRPWRPSSGRFSQRQGRSEGTREDTGEESEGTRGGHGRRGLPRGRRKPIHTSPREFPPSR